VSESDTLPSDVATLYQLGIYWLIYSFTHMFLMCLF